MSSSASSAQKIRDLREATGCGLTAVRDALCRRDWDYECAMEYLTRTGLAVAFRGTPEQQEAARYPLWAARKRSRLGEHH